MSDLNIDNILSGIYRISWKEDHRHSVAAIGMKSDGSYWIAPTNWVSPVDLTEEVWDMIDELQALIYD